MSEKRVLYIDLAPHPGGSVISLSYLLRGLADSNARWRPMVVLSRQNEFDGFEKMGIPVARVRTPQREPHTTGVVENLRQGKAGASIRNTPGLSKIWHMGGRARHWQRDVLPVVQALTPIIRAYQPDLIHLNDSLPLMHHGLLAAWRTRTPAIVHARAFVPLSRFDRQVLAPRLRGMIFISQAMAEHQLQGFKTPPRHQVIPNAVPVEKFQQEVDRTAVRRELGIPLDAPLIGMVGRLIAWKGQHVFVEAFARLQQQFPQARAVVVGDADTTQGETYAAALRARTRALGLQNHLFWLGYRRDLPQILAAIDILAHTSVRPEPFGRVLIESMAAGTPVIASRAGGALEIVQDGETGLLTPPGDVPALTAAMHRLLTDAPLRERLSQQGRAHVARHYTIASHAAAVANFYEALF